ncbi:hyaluronidase-1-like [Narcine bancroftii]|uniref:hyaluronidase-1-like n=1 Tax=Narcine bancroftii TaxID=1343680 RepID=UPI003831F513
MVQYFSAIMRIQCLNGNHNNPLSIAIIQFALFASSCLSQPLHQTVNPLIENSPFTALWNAPTELCETRFGVAIDLSLFEIIGSPLETATGQPITIFYHNRLGYYPYYDELTKEAFNGGLPQLVALDRHRLKSTADIQYYIPSDEYPGLAVINWENWRPQWIRNWGQKDIYRMKSIELFIKQNISMNMKDINEIVEHEFEEHAKNLMISTLKLGKSLRSNYLWGYYLYPECYNYDYKDLTVNYTGKCPDIEISRNDALLWLWNESTALFPSIYLQTILRDSVAATKFVHHRIQEAKRVALLSTQEYSPPLYVYTRPVFTDSPMEYLSEIDLLHTIGESAALGTAGFVVWGSLNMTDSKLVCLTVDNYVKEVLNPYIVNVTSAARLCSKILCRNEGRCVRKKLNSAHYLHLNPASFRIRKTNKEYIVIGQASFEDIIFFAENFACQCYAGQNCEPVSDIENYITELDTCVNPDYCISLDAYAELTTLSQIFDLTSTISSQNSVDSISDHFDPLVCTVFIALHIMHQM